MYSNFKLGYYDILSNALKCLLNNGESYRYYI